MSGVRTQVVVIGGGATGVGIARDLAMRGVEVALIERGHLGDGATGHCHCLLHSGGRYAVNDPSVAAECAEENAVLRHIALHCLEDTGGLFVALSADEGRYADDLLRAGERIGVPMENVSAAACRRLEPGLSSAAKMAVRVRDASVHPFVLVHATAEAARRHGADIRTHCDVAGMIRDGTRVHGVEVRDALRGETYLVHADIVVNAAGPWAGKVAALAGIDIPVRPNAGALAVLGVRVVGMTVHRCRPPSDGDIVVPLGKTAILGTTSRAIDDPDNVVVHEWEKDGLMGPAAEVVPGVRHAPLLRMFAGARPLFSRGEQDGRQASRGFAVLDHGQRDGVRGFLSVVGGKLTIHRLMAERTADVVCGYLGVGAECRTAIEPLPPIPAALEASVPEDNPLRLA